MGLDDSLNWVIEHWYYWIIIIITIVLFNLYTQLKKLKMMYSHWTETRLKEKMKDETQVNPPTQWKWLAKRKNVVSDKVKLIGRIRSFDNKVIKNPDESICTIVADTRLFGKFPLGRKRVFLFNPHDVIMDESKGLIVVRHYQYWSQHPSGEWILIGSDNKETFKYAQGEINKDLKRLAIDGYASQMASYSAVRPTWGHEADIVKREQESKFGFLEKFKKKPEKRSEE